MPLFRTNVQTTFDGSGGNEYVAPDYGFSPPGRDTFLIPRIPILFAPGLSRSQAGPGGMNANEISLKTPRWYALTGTQPGVTRTRAALATGILRRYNLIEYTGPVPPVSKAGA